MTYEFPPLPTDQDSYEQFKDSLSAMHRVAAPDCPSEFFEDTMLYSNNDGSYYFFPHPRDRQEVLTYARELAKDGDAVQRSLILPVGVLAVHPYENGCGRLSRAYHARLAGRSPTEIAAMGICGPRPAVNADLAAREIINLQPPEPLEPYIQAYTYESAGVEKRATLYAGSDTFGAESGVGEYRDVLANLPRDHRRELKEALLAYPFRGDQYYVQVDDPASLEFAISASQPGKTLEGTVEFIDALAGLGGQRLEQFIDDMWRFRKLRAQANISCLGYTAFGSRVISIADHAEALPITDHYVQLTNNLVK